MKLSIGKAWDETKAIVARDGGLLFTIVAALLVLPGTIVETLSPSGPGQEQPSALVFLLKLIVLLVSLAAQVAISRIGIGHATTVGETIGFGFRRTPALFGALMVMSMPFLLLVMAILFATGAATNLEAMSLSAMLLITVLSLGFLVVLVRLLFMTPLAADGRPFSALIPDSWALSAGNVGKLVLVMLALILVVLVLIVGLGGAISAVAIILAGPVEPGNVSALLTALFNEILAGAVSLYLSLVMARLYVQARDGMATVSVPDAGHQ